MSASIVAVCLGQGGIPNQPVESAQVEPLGLVGDKHRSELHGGLDRAICLLSEEVYANLRADDVDCHAPGTFGENILARGLDDARLRPGDQLSLGPEVIIEIYDVSPLPDAEERRPPLPRSHARAQRLDRPGDPNGDRRTGDADCPGDALTGAVGSY